MDPIERIPAELHDILLQYFTAQELLEVVSTVSKSWYGTVAKSQPCLKRIKLNLRSRRKNDFAEKIETVRWMSRKEGRMYQHLQINCLLDWRISSEVWNFLKAVGETVEDLNLRSMKLDPDVELDAVSLPKLEVLKLMFVPRSATNLLLTSSKSLKKLIMRNEFPLCYDDIDYTPSESTLSSVKKCLKDNKKLQEVEIQGRPHFFSFFQEKFEDLPELRKFVVKVEMSLEKIVPIYEENFLDFLTRQSNCLQHVYVDNCGPRVFKKIFNEMPELSFIRFDINVNMREAMKFSISELQLTPNERIKHLELPYVDLFADLKEFLALAPNVEEILIGHVNPLVVEFITRNLLKLRSVVYRYDDCAVGCEKCYNDLKAVIVGGGDGAGEGEIPAEVVVENAEDEQEGAKFNPDIKFSLCNDFM